MRLRDHIGVLWEWTEDTFLVDTLLSRAEQSGLRIKTFTPADFKSLDIGTMLGCPPIILWDRAGDIYPEAQRLSDWARCSASVIGWNEHLKMQKASVVWPIIK